MWNLAFSLPPLSIFDLIILVSILGINAFLFFKFQASNFKWAFAFFDLGIVLVLIFSSFFISPYLVDQIARAGLLAIPILWAIDVLTPPYPTSEIVLLLPLVYVFGLPFYFAEGIAVAVAILILVLTYGTSQAIVSALVQGFSISLTSWLITVIWFAIAWFAFEGLRLSRK